MNLALIINKPTHLFSENFGKNELIDALVTSRHSFKIHYIRGFVRYTIYLKNGVFFTMDAKIKRSDFEDFNLYRLIHDLDTVHVKSVKVNFYNGYINRRFGKPRKKVVRSTEWSTTAFGPDSIGLLRENKVLSGGSGLDQAFFHLIEPDFDISNICFSREDLVTFLLDVYKHNPDLF